MSCAHLIDRWLSEVELHAEDDEDREIVVVVLPKR